jgi:hypothetical protein
MLLKLAREHGTRISLGTGAHHPWHLEFIDLGLAAALRAKIPGDRILNFMPLGELQAWTQRMRDPNTSKIQNCTMSSAFRATQITTGSG